MVINFCTVCTDNYPMVYAKKIHKQFQNLTKLDVKHHCITDRPMELPEFVKPIEPYKKSNGWWNKINLFNPNMPKGHILYLDLDVVILDNFDEEILFMKERQELMCCVSDAIEWMGVKFSSSLMFFKSGVHSKIFENFLLTESVINNREGGDQVWTGPQLDSIYYIDKRYPNLKKNFKFHLAKREGKKFTVPMVIDKKIKLIDFGGKTKPHQFEKLPYIKKNWHLI